MVMDSKAQSLEASKSAGQEYEHFVGREFVRQYYTLLNQSPAYLHRFYADNSSFVHGALDPVHEDRNEFCEKSSNVGIVYGQVAIHQRIMQLNFQDCKTKIRQVDAQATLGNGVVVQVIGELSNSGQPMRRFMQTFVLEPQGPKKFYVRNDIFRYQDEVFSVTDACSSTVDVDSVVPLSGYKKGHALINAVQNAGKLQNAVQNVEARECVTPANISHQLNTPAVSEKFNSIGTYASLTMVEAVPARSSTYVSESFCQPDSMMSFNTQRKSTETLPLIGEGLIKNINENSEAEAEHAMEEEFENEEHSSHRNEMKIAPDSSTTVSDIEKQEELIAVECYDRKSVDTTPVIDQCESQTDHIYNHVEVPDSTVITTIEDDDLQEENQYAVNVTESNNESKTFASLFKSGTLSTQNHILNVNTGGGLPSAGFSKIEHANIASLQGPESQAPTNLESLQGVVPQSSQTSQSEAASGSDSDSRKETSIIQPQHLDHYQNNSAGASHSIRSGFSTRGSSAGFRGSLGRQANGPVSANKDKFFPDSQQIFVGNLPNSCTELEIANLFSKFGKVAEVRIIHKTPGQQKFTVQGKRVPSFGFVVFEAENSVEQCLKNTPVLMDDGHRLNIEFKKGKFSADNSQPGNIVATYETTDVKKIGRMNEIEQQRLRLETKEREIDLLRRQMDKLKQQKVTD